MNYIIDGFNLGYKLPAAAERLKKGEIEIALPIILNFIRSVLPAGVKIIVVFDGKKGVFPALVHPPGIRVKFSHKPQTADDIIREFIRYEEAPKNWTVITSDNEIIYTARDMGAHVITSQQFAGRQNSKKTTAENPQKYRPQNIDVEAWLKLFNAKGGE